MSKKMGLQNRKSWEGYEREENQPKAAVLFELDKLGVDIHWLFTGYGEMFSNRDFSSYRNNFVGIPRMDAKLSAGYGEDNPDAIHVLDHIPFTDDFLRKIGRSNIDGLKVLEVTGDSMEPTISNGDLVLVDEKKKGLRSDGIYALVHEQAAIVKRLRHIVTGGIEIISDNSAIYPPQTITGKAQNDTHIIGKVIWAGRLLAQ